MIPTLEDKYRCISKMHRQLIINYLKQFDLYMGQPRILFTIEEEPGLTQNELVHLLDVAKESLSLSLNRLEQNQLIYRVQNEKDKRSKKIFLTEKGKNTVLECKKGFNLINQSMFNELSNKERDQLDSLFDKMLDSITQEIDNQNKREVRK